VRVSSCSGCCRKGRYAAAEEARTSPMMGAMFLILCYLLIAEDCPRLCQGCPVSFPTMYILEVYEVMYC
jgi:hypothetical protein